MAYGLVQNKAGKFVQPDAAGFQAAASSADWPKAQDFYRIMTDAPGEDAYPIAATVFILMSKHPRDPARSKQAFEFFRWALETKDRNRPTNCITCLCPLCARTAN